MKIINQFRNNPIIPSFVSKMKYLILILLGLSSTTHAVQVVNEQFATNINGWSVSNTSKVYYSSSYSGSMFMDRQDTAERTYNFGPTYANQTMDIELRWCATNQWESNNDYLRVRINGSTEETDYDGGGCQTTTFTGDADGNGDFTIQFSPRSSSNNEDAYIMWFTVDGTPLATGCDSSLDTNANNNSPGVAVPNLDGTSSDASKCISGSSASEDEEYYHFTVNVDGVVDILTSSPNEHSNHFEVISNVQGTLHSYDTNKNRSLSYNLVANERITILFKETGSDTDLWQADLAFTAAIVVETPPIMSSIGNQTVPVSTPYSFDISTYVTPTDGDAITQYNLSCLPPGLSFNTNTGVLSGTPTAAPATHNCNATAEDNDGLSNSESFTLTITPQSPPSMAAIADQSAIRDDVYSFSIATFATETDGDSITGYGLTGSLPAGLSFNSTTGLISGTPTVTGTFTLGATATDNDGTTNPASSFDLVISATPPSCANYDTTSNSSCPGNIVLNMDGVTTNKTRCIYGRSHNDDGANKQDYYNFTVNTFGTLTTSAHTENDSAFYFGVSSACGSYNYYDGVNTSSIKHHPNTVINLVPGDTVYFYIKESGSPYDDYRIDFDFQVDTTFHAVDDIYNIPTNKDSELDVLRNDNPGANTPLNTSSLTIVTAPLHGTISIVSGLITYTPALDYNGTDTFTYTVEDNAGTTSNEATVNILIGTVFTKGDRGFTIRNPIDTRNINGNYIIGGNMSLCEDNGAGQCRNTNSNSNGNDDIYIDIDSDSNTTNSTSFDLNLPAQSTVLWAGLYWQGVVHRSIHNGDFMGNTVPSNAPLLGGSTNQIDLTNNTYGADIVKLKLPSTSGYTTIRADQLDYSKLGYGGFADVTTLLDPTNPNGTYMLADVKCHTGAEPDHGNYGGWSLVVIYNNPNEDFRNVTVFDGFATVDSSYNGNLLIEGFLTPKKAPINSKIAFFTMDGEGGSGGTLNVISDSLGGTLVSNAENPQNSVFNSTITGVNNRQPNYPSLRLDLDVFELANILGPNEQKATLQPRSGGDRYTASYFIMSSDLIQPELCYDYDARVGYVKIISENREIEASSRGNQPLSLKLLIRSMIADFVIEEAKAYIDFVPSGDLTYKQGTSEISPADINAYVPATVLNTSIGKIGIGHAPWTNGGTINPDESTYFKQDFDFNKSSFDGKFNIIIEAKIDYLQDGNPFSYTISTENNTIKKCPTNPVYDPIRGMFNIENATALSSEPISKRYPLYTQVTGRAYDIVLAHYIEDGSGEFSIPEATDAIVEVELIDAESYDNNASTGYDSTCQEPTAATQGGFVQFNNSASGRITFNPMNDFPNYDSSIALKSAAFRMWILVHDLSGGAYTLVNHGCVSASDKGCFETLYANEYETAEDNGTQYCSVNCAPAETSATACYDCLRKYFAVPICSRDNFSIRPESFQVKIQDNNESITSVSPLLLAENNTSGNSGDLAAEYEYPLNVSATIFPNSNIKSIGYHNNEFEANTYTSATLPNITQVSTSLALLKFNDNASCADKSSETYLLQFYNSQLEKESNLTHSNVGSYDFTVKDSSWTSVDQARYIHKTEFGAGKVNDCDTTSSSSSLQSKDVGCIIASDLNTHTNINLNFKPYSFDLSSITATLPNANDFIYVNQLDTANILDLKMSAKLDGNVTALGKSNTVLSNFTSSCAAYSVSFDINRTISRGNTAINENNLSSIDLISTIPVHTPVHLQRLYVDKDGIPNYSIEDNLTASHTLFTMSKNQFLNENNGSAIVDLYYNLERKNNKVMNPVTITFISKDASSSAASSSAHLGTHIPTGTAAFNINPQNLYYGRVAPSQDGPYLVTRSETSTIIPMYVEVYCNEIDMNCTQHQLNIKSQRNPNEWWNNTTHISSAINGDGNILTISDAQASSPLTITPNSNISLNLDVANSKTDIAVSINSSVLRPYNTTLNVVNDVWLGYNPGGLTNPIVNFLGGGGWAGKGNTGNIVNTNPYFDDQNKRSEW